MSRKQVFACFICVLMFAFPGMVKAETKLLENDSYTLNFIPYFRTDVITLKNNVDLDNTNSDDTTSFVGIDYSLAFDLKSKSSGPEYFLKLERNGPYDYSAPLFIHNTLATSSGRVEGYSKDDFLPNIEEFWIDTPLGRSALRAKGGLFTYNVGHGYSLNGAYENYGLHIYKERQNLKWGFYYCAPDAVNKLRLGPRIRQEKEQGIAYEHSKASFFAADVKFSSDKQAIQPYIGVLLDNSNNKRVSNFGTPTRRDTLGTYGLSCDMNYDKLALELEVAKNFGKAKSSDEAYRDVRHNGYLICTKASYDLDRFSPHTGFVSASGNKITPEMVENGDTVLTSGKNRAFSVYSPFNTALADSIYPNVETVPIVAMGGGYGINYGISRPGTFNDPRLFENLLLYNLGFDYKLTDKLTCVFDWWHLRAKEKGVGTFNGIYKKLSPDLGQEVDLTFEYEVNDNFSTSLLGGYFVPGEFYKEERDDTGGSLFTPFVRGDGKADESYQIEVIFTLSF